MIDDDGDDGDDGGGGGGGGGGSLTHEIGQWTITIDRWPRLPPNPAFHPGFLLLFRPTFILSFSLSSFSPLFLRHAPQFTIPLPSASRHYEIHIKSLARSQPHRHV